MAGRFEVTAAELKNAASVLTEKNGQFVSAVNELEGLQQELKGMWEGEANNAFNNAFQTDKGKWTQFSQTVTQYIQALQNIAQTYEQTEATNTATATSRG